MARVAKWIGLAVVFAVVVILAIAALSRIAHAFGLTPVVLTMVLSGVLALASMTTAWSGHDDDSLVMREAFMRTVSDFRWSWGQVASSMSIPQSALNRQLDGQEMLSLYRIAKLGKRFRIAFAKHLLELEGDCTLSHVLRAVHGSVSYDREVA